MSATGSGTYSARCSVRCFKDLVDDINVSTEQVVARGIEPDSHDRVLPRKPWHILRQYLVDALLLGVLNPLSDLLDHAGLLPSDEFWGMTRGERSSSTPRPFRSTTTASPPPTSSAKPSRYPLNGYRLTLGYTDLDTRPPIPTTGRIPNPLHTAKPIKPRTSW
jgi:hypothetical protein